MISKAAHRAPCLLITAAVLTAVLRASITKSLLASQPMTPQLARSAWNELVRNEQGVRAQSAIKFPGDAWSADDDFHYEEQRTARAFAAGHNLTLSDVLDALDQGMRAKWAAPQPVNPSVPPCRPRLMY